MKRLSIAALILALAAAAFAQGGNISSLLYQQFRCKSTAPDAPPTEHTRVYCLTSNSHTYQIDSAGTPIDLASVSNSFATIDTPTGTDPTADTATDSIQLLTTAPLTIAGANDPETITFGWSGAFADAQIDGSLEADELVLAGDVDGAANANDLDEAAVESELEGVVDLQDLQGAVTDAQVPNTITVDLATLATTATTANAGDSATAFFSSGTLEVARGGTGVGTSTGTTNVVLSGSPTIVSPTITTDLIASTVTAHPAVSATGPKMYAYRTGALEPAMPTAMPSAPAIPLPMQPLSMTQTGFWRMIFASSAGAAGVTGFGIAQTAADSCTVTAAAWAVTTLLTRTARVTCNSVAATNRSAGWRDTASNLWIGDGAAKGGFIWYAKVAMVTTAAGSRTAFGLRALTTDPTASADPSNWVNTVYVGCDSADTTLHVCANDNTSTASCTDLAGNFPCNTSGALYEIWIFAEPNASTTLSYSVNRLDSAFQASGTFPTGNGTPQNSVSLASHIWMNTGSGSAAVVLGLIQMAFLAGY